ncbi:MAG: type VI secretion system membrane subunit TssM [Shimia sp.]
MTSTMLARSGIVGGGAVLLVVTLWFGLPMLPLPFAGDLWFRLAVVLAVLAAMGGVAGVRWWRRRRDARVLGDAVAENETLPEVVEKIEAALETLEETRGGTALVDLPWYLIVGPSGAGKTVALTRSGLGFVDTDVERIARENEAGSKNLDFLFADEAVLIDTAGRYVSNAENREKDAETWRRFLERVKGARRDQPINGIVLAFPVPDLLPGPGEADRDVVARIDGVADVMRMRLKEIHERLRVRVPVYAMLTKTDRIAGFEERFSEMGEAERRQVWGVTFQDEGDAEPHRRIDEDFDHLLRRLSESTPDRLKSVTRPDAAAAIMGFPAALAELRPGLTRFVQRVFRNPDAIGVVLRGVYLTSGTQGDTPANRLLTALGLPPSEGRDATSRTQSFFLHDLFKEVIFPERHWVGHDERAVGRRRVLRGAALGAIGGATAIVLSAIAGSWWQTHQAIASTRQEADLVLASGGEITTGNPRPALAALAGVDALHRQAQEGVDWRPGLRLPQRQRAVRDQIAEFYKAELWRHLLPRASLALEDRMTAALRDDDLETLYAALAAYLTLWNATNGNDGTPLDVYLLDLWKREGAVTLADDEAALERHLAALQASLSSPPDQGSSHGQNWGLIEEARDALRVWSVEDRAWGQLLAQTPSDPGTGWDVLGDARIGAVFQARGDGDVPPIPALFTGRGYHEIVLPFLGGLEGLAKDEWVFGDDTPRNDPSEQMDTLRETLERRYAAAFEEAWYAALEGMRLKPLAAAGEDITDAAVFLELASTQDSPLFHLVDEVADGTDLAVSVPAAGDGSQEPPALSRPARDLQAEFDDWRALARAAEGRSPIQRIVEQLAEIRRARTARGSAPDAGVDMLQALVQDGRNARPALVNQILDTVEDQLVTRSEAEAYDALVSRYEADVRAFCQRNVANRYPFAGRAGQAVDLDHLKTFFAPDRGLLDVFFDTYLAPHVDTGRFTPNGATPLSDRLRDEDLKVFRDAETIQALLFTDGQVRKGVDVSLTAATSPDVAEVELALGNTVQALSRGARSAALDWPGGGAGTLSITPRLANGTAWKVPTENGLWSLGRFIEKAGPRVDGETVVVQFVSNERTIALEFAFAAIGVPFSHPAVRGFSCDDGLRARGG